MLGDVEGESERARGKYDQNTLHACIKLSINTHILK